MPKEPVTSRLCDLAIFFALSSSRIIVLSFNSIAKARDVISPIPRLYFQTKKYLSD
jgi:hypothetical protein